MSCTVENIGDWQIPPFQPIGMLPTVDPQPIFEPRPVVGGFIRETCDTVWVQMPDGRTVEVLKPPLMQNCVPLWPEPVAGITPIWWYPDVGGKPIMVGPRKPGRNRTGCSGVVESGLCQRPCPPWGCGPSGSGSGTSCCEQVDYSGNIQDPAIGDRTNLIREIDHVYCGNCGSGLQSGGCGCGSCLITYRVQTWQLAVPATLVEKEDPVACITDSGCESLPADGGGGGTVEVFCCANDISENLTLTFDGSTGAGWVGQTIDLTYNAVDGYWSGSKTITGCTNQDFLVEARVRCHDPGSGYEWQYWINLTGGDCTAWTAAWTTAASAVCLPFSVKDNETTAAGCCDLADDGIDFTVTEA